MTDKLQLRKGRTLASKHSCFFLLVLLACQTNGLPRHNAFKKGNSRTRILLMMRANSTYGLEDVMSETPPCPDMLRSKSSFDRQVIDSDYYGSSLLDEWKEHTPVHLSLLLTNYRGDIMWGSSFQVQDKNSSRLHTWFKSENIVRLADFTDYLESPDTLTTNIGTSGFSAVLQQQSSNNTAYLGIIQQNENITRCSKMPSFFYFSNSSNTPFKIRAEQSTDFKYIGCYEPANLTDYAYGVPRDLGQCHKRCSSEGYEQFGFRKSTYTCHCIPSPTLLPSFGTTEDNCTLITGYVMIDYRTVNVPFTQTEIVVKTTDVTAENETKVDFGNATGYVTAVQVYNQTGPCQYILMYSTLDCESDDYHKLGGNKTYDCGVKEYLKRGVQKVKCLIFNLPDLVYAGIDIYGIEEPYIAGPVLIVLGHYDHNPVEDGVHFSTTSELGMTVKSTSTLATETISTTVTILTTETVSVTEILSSVVPMSETLRGTVVSDNPSGKCCFCDCSMYTAYYKWHTKKATSNDLVTTNSEESSIASVTNELKANTTVKKTALSSYVRTKTCASDPRPAVRYVGTCGILLLVIVLICIILVDISSLRSHINTIRHGAQGQ